MAVKTMSAGGGSGKFVDGWHELTITHAAYGVYKGANGDRRYVTLSFDGYPDNMDLRIYEVVNKETGDEFKISNVFKYANAGIMDKLKDPTGKKPIIQYDDEATNLVDKKINVLFYKERKTGNSYTRLFDSIAPVEQEGEHLSYTADQVTSIQSGVEKNLERMLSKTDTGSDTGFGTVVTKTKTTTSDAEIPF